MNRPTILTKERLNKAKTPKGSYRKTQLQMVGVDWPLKQGWKKDLIGKKVTLKRFIAFVAAGGNKLYLEEITSLLPILSPPITGTSIIPVVQTKLSNSNKTTKRMTRSFQASKRPKQKKQPS